MTKNKEDLKIIMFQFRLAPEMRAQELRCYNKYSTLRSDQIEAYYLLENNFYVEDLNNFDAVIIGGTGDFGVYEVKKKYPQAYEQLKQIAFSCRDKNIPVLTVCMQFWGILFGGVVTSDISRQEVGTFSIFTTEEAKKDPLFQDMPNIFWGQVGHKDYISKVPDGGVLLAYSDLCPTHAFRLDNAYILQFHPELDPESMRERIDAYPSYAKANPEEYKKVIESLREASENNLLLRKWIERIVMN